ncbi:MAG: aminoacetone oxidase family FAD-binding enzyme [Candidatus Gracilibacteria bacterium]|nr:aminoacetone oxidase family FAD-binding enzyme [Candidatus Gracilibacteria bacterium]
MIYDVVIVGAGAAGLFAGINLDKKYKKLILEKTAKPGMKVLLSGGERANVSNSDIEPTRDYFTQNKKFLLSIFSRYNQWDIMSFFALKGINIVEEDRHRLILESGDSKELLNCLLDEINKNKCELKVNQDVKDINKLENGNYEIIIESGEKYFAKNVIISSGGKSFSHIGTTGEGYNIAQKLGLKLVVPYRTLCGMSTKKDMSEVSGVSTDLSMILVDKNNTKPIYSEAGPMLFTHFGISGPIVHNLSNAIGEYLNNLKLEEVDFEKYIIDNLSLNLTFDLEKTPKRLVKFFELKEDNIEVNLELQNWRSWKEAKATGGGIDTDELDNHMQSKKYPGLYFIGEVVDVTGKTGGFNLQWAWSSAYVASENINKNSQ